MNTHPKIYLDHAAATPLNEEVLLAMMPYLKTEFANPSSIYTSARITRQALNEARSTAADILGAKPTEIVWTSGGTESVNLAIQGILRAFPGGHWVTSAIEHDAVLVCRDPLSKLGNNHTTVGVSISGLIDPTKVLAAVTDRTVLISLVLANNEIGTIQPLSDLMKLVQQIRSQRELSGNLLPLYVHTDACQAAGYLNLAVSRLEVDLMSINGGKIYGPRGSGLLYVRQGTVLEPLIYGGGQERGRRSGTENVASAVGLAKALEITQSSRAPESRRLQLLRDRAIKAILTSIAGSKLNGDHKHRLPNNINLTLPGVEGQALILYLDKIGIMASTGSACSSDSLEPSHVLTAIGNSPEDAASSLRLTMGRTTTAEDMGYLVEHLPGIVERLRSL